MFRLPVELFPVLSDYPGQEQLEGQRKQQPSRPAFLVVRHGFQGNGLGVPRYGRCERCLLGLRPRSYADSGGGQSAYRHGKRQQCLLYLLRLLRRLPGRGGKPDDESCRRDSAEAVRRYLRQQPDLGCGRERHADHFRHRGHDGLCLQPPCSLVRLPDPDHCRCGRSRRYEHRQLCV